MWRSTAAYRANDLQCVTVVNGDVAIVVSRDYVAVVSNCETTSGKPLFVEVISKRNRPVKFEFPAVERDLDRHLMSGRRGRRGESTALGGL